MPMILHKSPVLIVSIVSAAVSYLIGNVFSMSLYADGLAKLLIFAVLYMSWSLLFKPEAFTYTKEVVMPLINRVIKRKK